MINLQESIATRVLRWRFEGLKARNAQAVLIAALCAVLTQGWLSLPWLVVAILLAKIDADLSRKLYATPDDRRLTRLTSATRILSAGAYSTVCFLFLATRSPIAIAGAIFVSCAINLNNVMMTRGAPRFALTLLVPSCVVLVILPLAAVLMGHSLAAADTILLTVGALAYALFIARLAIALNREGAALDRATREEARQRDFVRAAEVDASRERRRWNMVFDQSPLAQICFDATALHDHLKARAQDDACGRPPEDMTPHQMLDLVTLTEANRAALALFGVDGFSPRFAPRSHFGPGHMAGVFEALANISPEGVFQPFESQVIAADGEVTDVRVHIRTLPDGDSPWSHCLCTYVDMTEVKRAARAQQEAVEIAEASNRAKSEFLAIMSHEIRTPLNGVLGMAQALSAEALSEGQAAKVGVIRQSGEALLAILGDLLDLSKIEAGRLDLESAPFRIEDVAGAAHDTFAALAQAKGVTFELTVSDAARGAYQGDAFRIRQVLTNLISNAVKFTEAGHVSVRVDAHAGGLRLSVADTGLGIAADRIGSLFDKFVQADTSTTRRFGGAGLGLAISRELCEAMGGAISVESEPGRGSTFHADLPLVRLATSDPDDAQEDVRLQEAAPLPAMPRRVLAAEDNTVNQLVLRALLQQVGIEPEIVGNGAEAVEAWAAGDWDLILMDVQMPVMDGPTATRAIRDRERLTGRARTPIIALTANTMSHQVAAYGAAGMDGVVAKPIEVSELYEALAGAVRAPEPARKPARKTG